MEFSWSYKDIMSKMVKSTTVIKTNDAGVDTNQYMPIFIEYPLRVGEEIPSFGAETARQAIIGHFTHMVITLTIDPAGRTCRGVDTMLKYFSRAGYSYKLLSAVDPKGDVYYGNSGIVLDSNFTPLLFVTRPIITYNDGYAEQFAVGKPTVHLHPNVFIDDTGFINKSLARKATAFYLSQDIYCNGNYEKAKLVIDDCSSYIKKVARPNPNDSSTENMYDLLKDNIDEVLGQVIYD